MLMQRLLQFSRENEELARQLSDATFEDAPVRWLISIDDTGRYLGVVDRRGDAKRTPALRIPKVGARTVAPVPNLAVDSIGYVLGPAPDTPAADLRKHTQQQHALFVELVERAAAETHDAALEAVRLFYADPDNLQRLRADLATRKLDGGDRFAFTLHADAGRIVADRPAARAFWAAYSAERAAARGERKGGGSPAGGAAQRCMVCGLQKPIADRHMTKIMGVPDGQASGTSLISFNAQAFLSYDWKESFNSPICLDCVEAYSRALNHLLKRDNSPHTRIDESGVAVLFWAVGGETIDLADLLEAPDAEAVANLLRAARTGRLSGEIDEGAFCTLALSGAGGRVMVRAWLDTTIAAARRNLARWFEDLAVVAYLDIKDKDGAVIVPRGAPAPPPSLYLLLGALARDPKELPKHLVPGLVRAALSGGPLPDAALALAVRRIAVERGPGYPRLAAARIGLIRAALNRRPDATPGERREMSNALDEGQESVGYLCGRMLAVLESIQYGAVGDVGADIVDRFYGRAATAPVSAFPILMKLAQSHLRTLKRDKPGLAVVLDRELGGICARLAGFPVSLSLAEQGRFALGYYHQRASVRGRGKAGEAAPDREDDDQVQAS